MNFNFIAPYYDFLTRIVFGQTIIESKTTFLKNISNDSTVLIIGGGTGVELRLLSHVRKVLFVDSSSKMIDLAKRKHPLDNVVYLNRTIEACNFTDIDIVVANFFLDIYSENDLSKILNQISSFMTKEGELLVTDFYSRTLMSNFTIWSMYKFFYVVARLKNQRLPDLDRCIIDTNKFTLTDRREFFKGLIISSRYKKRELG